MTLGKLREWLRERGVTPAAPAMVPGSASFAYVLGAVLMLLLAVEAVTGIALAAFYSPSSTDAWASVAYVQDQAAMGWMIRGLHFHGASAIMIISGIHLVQTAVYGAYKKPRELVWWLGILLMILMLAWAVTGYVLRWDQAGYWANKVEIGIAAATPLIGDTIKSLALGGNDYGNLTLTRFYSLHVIVLPAVVGLVTAAHVMLARKHGLTASPRRVARPAGSRAPTNSRAASELDGAPAAPRWPNQTLRNVIAMTIVFTILFAYVLSMHGVDLAAPADPSQAYDARPLWYFRWLFELRELAGAQEKLAALAAPAIVAGVLVALPLVDRGQVRHPLQRLPYLGGLAGLLALICGLTVASLYADASNPDLDRRETKATLRANLARKLARENGVPSSGALDVFMTPPMAKARASFAQRCKSCHAADSKDRKGPVIGPGYGNRAWLKAFIKNPSGDEFWGRTKLAVTEQAMKPFDRIAEDELDDLVELLYSESGAADVVEAKRDRGAKLFEATCTDCHSREEGQPGASGPNLADLGMRDHYTSFIGNPKSAIHMGATSEMPRFDKELTLPDRDGIAEYLVWLRTATKADLAALDPF